MGPAVPRTPPPLTRRAARIQDAFTRIQAAEESGRGGASDDEEEDDEEDYDDDDYYDDYEAFEEAAFMFMFAFGGGVGLYRQPRVQPTDCTPSHRADHAVGRRHARAPILCVRSRPRAHPPPPRHLPPAAAAAHPTAL